MSTTSPAVEFLSVVQLACRLQRHPRHVCDAAFFLQIKPMAIHNGLALYSNAECEAIAKYLREADQPAAESAVGG